MTNRGFQSRLSGAMARRRSGFGPRVDRVRGAVAVLVALLSVFIFGIAAFGIDLTRALVVRNEVQNAADAAALAGAGVLFPLDAGRPNWAAAQALAATQITANKSEGISLSTVSTSVGFWNIATRSSTWDTSVTPGANDVPALKVVVQRDTGVNGGPMLMSFGRLLGFNVMPAGATAVAVITWPASAGKGSLAPYAMGECAFLNYWDSTTGQPRGDANGPYEIVLGNKNSCNPATSCTCGTWTSLDQNTNGTDDIRTLMVTKNTAPLAVGDNIWIKPGVASTLFGDFGSLYSTPPPYPAPSAAQRYITIPVVADNCLDAAVGQAGRECPIKAYACFHTDYGVDGGAHADERCREGTYDRDSITGTPIRRTYVNPLTTSPAKCAVGYFVAGQCKVLGGEGGGGTYYGAYVPPRIGQ